ncbi:hypothetical protein OG562_17770 [Streptomyces sp. NBC_01275]|uniref:hypothetical protein n=1 Tax=Streptomyces sp. NBC_01275 TaxID=2903807 RepID=UPI00225728D5|nr:hypothetical protein [Streptomyces sp. NBC_01275]MCX4762793.1 hypothetical protein [Streptomyces sp. NBC_01275]
MSYLIPRNVFRGVILAGVLVTATGFAVQVEHADSRAQEVQLLAADSDAFSITENDHGWQ